MKKHDKQVIIVDDSPDYVYFLEQAIVQTEPHPSVEKFYSGADFLIWLETNKRPDLLFLDVGMPGQSGFDILQVLKTQEKYKMMPIIMLTVSEEEYDIQESYHFGANAYMIKPSSFDQLVTHLQMLFKFWFEIATIPKVNSSDNK